MQVNVGNSTIGMLFVCGPTNSLVPEWSKITNDATGDTKFVFYWDQPFLVGWVGWVFSCSIGKIPFSVGLVDQLFHPASN